MNTENLFKNPPREYSLAPFWFWNDDLKKEHLEMQLKEMYEKGVYEFIIHSRKGIQIEYLSEEWFDRIGFALDRAKEMGMKAWIYDEDNWPSGYAGGKVIQSNPDFKAKCLSMEKVYPVTGQPLKIQTVEGSKLVGVVAVYKNVRFLDLTDYTNNTCKSWTPQEYCWEVYVFRQLYGSKTTAYSSEKYVDLLNVNVTEKFMELTHREYKRRFPDHWGNTIKGFFTDEPGFFNNSLERGTDVNTIPWTDGFPRFFKSKKPYNIIEFLPAVWMNLGDISRKVRCDYYEVLAELYIESFFKPVYDFCAGDGLEYIGHVLIEENLKHIVRMQSHYFQTMRYLTVPGIDKISRERERITEKLASSASHIFNRKRSFSESYACSGWDLTLEEMKAVADWQYVQGVNMMVPHAFYSSIEGTRKFESPPSEFYQNTFWKYFNKYSDYMSRLSFLLSQGNHVCSTLVYYPITSCWEKIEPLDHCFVERIDDMFKKLSLGLLKRQIDFDYADDYAIKESAYMDGNRIHIHNESYRVVIVPFIYNIPLSTLEFLVKFVESGGIILSIGSIPMKGTAAEQDERIEELVKILNKSDGYYRVDDVDIQKIFDLYRVFKLLDVELDEMDENIKYLHRKVNDLQDAYFIINESENEVIHNIRLKCEGQVEEWNPETGETKPVRCKTIRRETFIDLYISGYGSKLLMFTRKKMNVDGLWHIEIGGKALESELTSWSELGFKNYSGQARYKKDFIFDMEHNGEIVLDLGQVKDCAEVYLNNEFLDTRVWRPYRFDITGKVRQGKNLFEVIVTNTMANEIEGRDIPSGLLGPVEIRCFEKNSAVEIKSGETVKM